MCVYCIIKRVVTSHIYQPIGVFVRWDWDWDVLSGFEFSFYMYTLLYIRAYEYERT